MEGNRPLLVRKINIKNASILCLDTECDRRVGIVCNRGNTATPMTTALPHQLMAALGLLCFLFQGPTGKANDTVCCCPEDIYETMLSSFFFTSTPDDVKEQHWIN